MSSAGRGDARPSNKGGGGGGGSSGGHSSKKDSILELAKASSVPSFVVRVPVSSSSLAGCRGETLPLAPFIGAGGMQRIPIDDGRN
jgi:hypothetical protein